MNRDELLRKIEDEVTPEMIDAGESAFDYPSDYLGPTVLKQNLPAVFAAMVLAYRESKCCEDGLQLKGT